MLVPTRKDIKFICFGSSQSSNSEKFEVMKFAKILCNPGSNIIEN